MLALTATATSQVVGDISSQIFGSLDHEGGGNRRRRRESRVVTAPLNRPNIEYYVRWKEGLRGLRGGDQRLDILPLLEKALKLSKNELKPTGSAIIYLHTRVETNQVSNFDFFQMK